MPGVKAAALSWPMTLVERPDRTFEIVALSATELADLELMGWDVCHHRGCPLPVRWKTHDRAEQDGTWHPACDTHSGHKPSSEAQRDGRGLSRQSPPSQSTP